MKSRAFAPQDDEGNICGVSYNMTTRTRLLVFNDPELNMVRKVCVEMCPQDCSNIAAPGNGASLAAKALYDEVHQACQTFPHNKTDGTRLLKKTAKCFPSFTLDEYHRCLPASTPPVSLADGTVCHVITNFGRASDMHTAWYLEMLGYHATTIAGYVVQRMWPY